MQVVLDTRGLMLSVRNRCFLIESGTESRIIHPQRISSFLITAPCRISSPALVLAVESDIQVVVCNNFGKPEARVWSPRFLNTSALRRMQYKFCESFESMNWAENIIRLKIEMQCNNLLFIASRKPSFKETAFASVEKIHKQISAFTVNPLAGIDTCKKQLRFCEAYAASVYWQTAGGNLPEPWTFSNRVKRNPPDAFNSCINYMYGILRNQVETAILSLGLDPALGILHRDGYRMPSLVFDLMEPFRPVMDKLLYKTILESAMPDAMILQEEGKAIITKAGRKKLITLFTEKLNTRSTLGSTTTTLNNLILHQVKNLTEQIRNIDNN
jgi:CRISP-associated protein Cas1